MKVYRNIKTNALLSVNDSIDITGEDWVLVAPSQENPEGGKAPEKPAGKTEKAKQ